MAQAVERLLPEIDIVLVSDYGKGVCAGQLVSRLATLARQSGVPVVVDPAFDVDYRRYAGCTCLKPNRREAGTALGRRIRTPEEGLEAARELLRFDVDTALVTLDRDGIAWANARGQSRLFPVQPRQIFDITGAGDMVLAALGYALAAGADWPTAIDLANLAGGLEVERLGAASLTRHELLAGLSSAISPRRSFPSSSSSIGCGPAVSPERRS